MTAPLQTSLPLHAPYQRGSDTSKAAAEAIEARLGRLQWWVLHWLELAGPPGLTREQISDWAGLKIQTICPRVAELLRAGLIRETDRRRATRSGRMAVVLTVAGQD